MKLKELIVTAATLVNKKEIVDYLTQDERETDESIEGELSTLIALANVVVGELAGTYIPMEKTEPITQRDGKILFSDLSETPLRVKALSGENGECLFYSIHPTYLYSSSKAATVTYEYLPATYALEDELGFKPKDISISVLAFGLAAEICLSESMFEEAVLWRQRYTDGISRTLKPKNARTAARRFI